MLKRIDSDTPKELLRDRRFKNDTVGEAFPAGKRLEKLFEMYTKMTSK
ncbi:hypothetical protein GS597_01995 [Synechococcales cyanobacterium C]|uniref:Uncharacterized protein n=1 Tax=Petrachloros mirabilis ULC683 TaxID=2781853 RepID=A0A8K1ZWE8_9CYAN|nr:hypothetical protein [Petrachloros mirabilis]NCJ05306.1 hypothetical protein [Petrachloros mirabilis ULC683]